tara:strand:- start:4369 stop:6429 length:2061 start_codon:yes stop_codon:yes gene_type:complete
MANRSKNPKDATWPLFKKLTRLFSGPLINYRSQTTRQLSRRRLDKYSSRFKDVAGQKFQKLSYNPFDNLSANIMSQQNRNQRYIDFDQMEYTPEIASSLDIYADEMTTSNDLRKMITIKCPNEEIKGILETLYYNILNVDFNLFGWCRTMCKYGDFFLYLDLNPEVGITNVIGLPSSEVERLEGEDKTNPNYVQFQWNTGGMTFENWQMSHFRILGNDKYAPYGTSVLEAARRIWRQLTLLEDAMMAYRIVRSPERRVFYIDVGNINPSDVEQYMQKAITAMKRNQVVDADTGRVDLRYNPMSIDEDYFIPVRGGQQSTRIEALPGGTYTGDIDDVKYLRDKLFSALKVPQSYLAMGEGAAEDKATLAMKDIRFARTIQRLQRSVITELEKIGIVHLYTIGFKGDDLVSFTLHLNNPSKLAELQELEHWRMKFDTAASATEGFFSRRWVTDNLFGLSDEQSIRNQREMFFDRKFDTAMQSVAEAGMAQMAGAAAGAGAAMGMPGPGEAPPEGGPPAEGEPPAEGGGEGGELPPGTPEEEAAPGETVAEEGGEGEGGAESALLAAPGKRDEEDWHKTTKKDAFGRPKATTTSKSKGKWYKPVTYDTRDMGARRRHYKGEWANEVGTATKRNVHKGALELFGGFGKNAIFEEKETNYDKQEKKILQVNQEIKNLLLELEKRQDNEDEA